MCVWIGIIFEVTVTAANHWAHNIKGIFKFFHKNVVHSTKHVLEKKKSVQQKMKISEVASLWATANKWGKKKVMPACGKTGA